MLVATQFLSYKDFGEKLNLLLGEISDLNLINSEKNLMISIFKNFKKIFAAEFVHLWLVDNVIILYI